MASADRPLISVVVPTRDRPRALRSCLDGLAAQTAADRLEVVVVDDGSAAADDVAAVAAAHPFARLVRLAGNGPAAARNEGARQARGTVLCFTDDDCVPTPSWAERLADALDAGADAVAGRTIPAGGALAEAAELVAQAPAQVAAPAGGLSFAPSNNLACTRAVFASVPFDESYPDAAGEDREWCARLTGAGYALRSEPAAELVHRQQLTLRTFLARQVRYGEAAYRFRSRLGGRARLEPVGFYAALLRRSFARGPVVGLLVCTAQAGTAVGFARAWLARRARS